MQQAEHWQQEQKHDRSARSTRHRDGHDSACAGQETFLFGKWFGGGPPITAARLRPCPAPSTDVVLWGRRDNVLSGAAGPFSYKSQELRVPIPTLYLLLY